MPCTTERDGCLEGITGISISVTWLILLSWKASLSALVGTSMTERTGLASGRMRVLFCVSAEDETEGLEELDGEEIDDDKGGAAGDARAEGVEDVGQTAQTARYKADGDGDEAHAKGDDRLEATTEGRREEVARGGEEDGVGRQREQSQDDEVDDQEDEGDTESETVTER